MRLKLLALPLFGLLMLLAASGTAYAYTETTDGLTFVGPDTVQRCVDATTYDAISITGVLPGTTLQGSVIVQYVNPDGTRTVINTYTVNQTGTNLYLLISYPPVSQWPLLPDGTREIHVDVSISASGTQTALFDGLAGGKNLGWDVYCNGQAPEGCSPGYWKQPQHFDSYTAPYTPNYTFTQAFDGVVPAGGDSSTTLLAVLKMKGGGAIAMDRHAVGALLDAANPSLNYPLSVNGVISLVQYAYATGNFDMVSSIFEGYEQNCTLN